VIVSEAHDDNTDHMVAGLHDETAQIVADIVVDPTAT